MSRQVLAKGQLISRSVRLLGGTPQYLDELGRQASQSSVLSSATTGDVGRFTMYRWLSDVPSSDIIPAVTKASAPATQPQKASALETGTWTAVKDERTGQTYWWNQGTGKTTAVGAPNPGAWVAVKDEKSSGVYYWNQESGHTTAVGDPAPGPDWSPMAVQGYTPGPPGLAPTSGPAAPRTMVEFLTSGLALGFGVGLTFAIMRVLLG